MALACNPRDGLRTCLIEDGRREDKTRRFLSLVLRQYLTHWRPWWRHPRWHIHHWRFQVHPWQRVKRALERCRTCGERFGWNASGSIVQDGGHRENDRYVEHLHHEDCLRPAVYPTDNAA